MLYHERLGVLKIKGPIYPRSGTISTPNLSWYSSEQRVRGLPTASNFDANLSHLDCDGKNSCQVGVVGEYSKQVAYEAFLWSQPEVSVCLIQGLYTSGMMLFFGACAVSVVLGGGWRL